MTWRTRCDTTTADSEFWNSPTIGLHRHRPDAGRHIQYRVCVSDGDGNTVRGDTATITLPTATSQTAYDRQVISDGASSYWPLDEPSGTVFYDNAGFNDMDATAGVTRGAAGPVSGDDRLDIRRRQRRHVRDENGGSPDPNTSRCPHG